MIINIQVKRNDGTLIMEYAINPRTPRFRWGAVSPSHVLVDESHQWGLVGFDVFPYTEPLPAAEPEGQANVGEY